ncbi:MAG: 3-hydroxyacyl-ACP dehydratase FabZ [Candidatus Dasytiphilus stammeri]
MEEILQLLPHRYPFLFIDRVLSYSEDNGLRAIKNISFNEVYCQGHFPKKFIFPGVLILEAIAQAAVIFLLKKRINLKINENYYLSSIEKAIFKRLVLPGDQLILEVKLIEQRFGLLMFTGNAKVANQVACESSLKLFRKVL